MNTKATIVWAVASVAIFTSQVEARLQTGADNQGLTSLTDDVVLTDLATTGLTTLLDHAFEVNKTPEADRAGVRASVALRDLKAKALTLSTSQRQQLVNQVVRGVSTVLPQQKRPDQLADQANTLIQAGIVFEVNTIEYWGTNALTRQQLRPVVETVIAMLDRAKSLAAEQSEKLTQTIRPEDTATIARVQKLDELMQFADQTTQICNYYLALSLDPADAKRIEVAQTGIDYLSEFDTDDNPSRTYVRTTIGKLASARGDTEGFSKARAALDWVIATPETPADPTDLASVAQVQALAFEARYFRAVVEVMARDLPAARKQYDALTAWKTSNPSANEAGKKQFEAARSLLQYRIENLEMTLASDPAKRDAARQRATKILIDLLQDRPELEPLVLQQLLATVDRATPVKQLDILILKSLVGEGEAQVIKAQSDQASKVDDAVVQKAFEAATELVGRAKSSSVDPRVLSTAEFLTPFFLETLDRKLEAANKYLDFVEKYKDSDLARARPSLTNAQRLIGLLRNQNIEDPEVSAAFDRVFPIALAKPFDQTELAFTWALRLQRLNRPAEAVEFYKRVPADNVNFSASRFLLMIAQSQELDSLKPGTPGRDAKVSDVRRLADQVIELTRKELATVKPEQQSALKSRLARTAVMSADVARVEQNDSRKAIELLKDIESLSAGLDDQDELLGEAMFIRVQSNMQLGQTDAAVAQLVKLLETSGGSRGSQVVFTMLQSLENEFDIAKAANDRGRMAMLQGNRAALTPYLVAWAQKSTDDQVKKYVYSYKVLDAETQRLAADFLTDPQQQQLRRQEARKQFEQLDSPDGLAAYRATLPVAQQARVQYDRTVALSLARLTHDLEDFPETRNRYGRLLADQALGQAITVVRDSGQEREVDNDKYWEAVYKWTQASLKTGEDRIKLEQFLKQQYIRWGDRVGGQTWKQSFADLKQQLIPDFNPPATTRPLS